jgi:tRNA pseudouridine38-40 synthase
LIDESARESVQSRLKLILAYDGTQFSGSQRQSGNRTVQGVLEEAIASLINGPVKVAMAGRTDAGVHALGQVASCEDIRCDLEPTRLRLALNAQLPADVSVLEIARAASPFDPRRDARWRRYRYRIWVGPRQPLMISQSLQMNGPLNVMRMLHGAVRFNGEHDFASFAGLGKGVPGAHDLGPRGTVRTIYRAHVRSRTSQEYRGQVIEIDIVGDAFLPGQVRSMVGALLDVGRGKVQPDWIEELISAADRRRGPKAAPPHGLTLVEVGYEDWDPERISKRETGTLW